jgi:hypothetical protein
MTRFWLAVFSVDPARQSMGPPTAAQPLLRAGVERIALEVLWSDDESEYAVVVSDADRLEKAQQLTACIGFANGAKSSSVWRDRGFPLIDAQISRRGNALTVATPCFGKDKELAYDERLLTIVGIDFGTPAPDRARACSGAADANEAAASDPPSGTSEAAASGGPPTASPMKQYTQSQWSADYAWPGRLVVLAPVTWTPARSDVRYQEAVLIHVTSADTRSPNLDPLGRGGEVKAKVWTGSIDVAASTSKVGTDVTRANRADTFGAPAFRFEDVEVIGFRVELPPGRALPENALVELVSDLNFHLDPEVPHRRGQAPPDFRYCVATSTIAIELLRYGKMKLRAPWAPLDLLDYQSQHELLVRVLVGRVDDDTTQAHSPAAYVPAILVDNPWSKVLGRDVQGFDKRMAHFCVGQQGERAALRRQDKLVVLRPDGRVPGADAGRRAPMPLHAIRSIYLVERTGVAPDANGDTPLLELDCSAAAESDAEFGAVDLDLALSGSALAFTRWRRADFGDPEFRRAFSRTAVLDTVRGFRSVQVGPVGARAEQLKQEWRTWITGTFVIDDDLQIAPTRGLATLTLHNLASAPQGWKRLCALLGIYDKQTLSFPAGSWYRMRMSMDLTIDNGLV